ncbi:hypothetical protein [Nocardia sp. NPDC051833]|uniref:hypothetical protein n=1 Tax=Nocardia sp. NPDC051833 TaxID=3155674 RepID=UPI00342FEA13
MRIHTGRMAVALGTLAAALALGAGVASAAPITLAPDGGAGYNVTITDGGAPPTAHSCSVFGLGYAWGPASNPGTTALGGFLLPNSPVLAICTDGSVATGLAN